MKKTSILAGILAIAASSAFISPAFAGKNPVMCAVWQAGEPIETCEFNGPNKTAKIGSYPDGYGEAWNTVEDIASGFECSPETFGGNPFEGTGYTGKLQCYYD